MSGGSYNYLCYKDSLEEIICELKMLDEVADALIGYGYEDIAKDVRRLVEYINSSKVRIETLFDVLRPVFKAVEWYTSDDYGKDDLIKILEDYRNLRSDSN